MNIRQIKNYIVDLILNRSTIVQQNGSVSNWTIYDPSKEDNVLLILNEEGIIIKNSDLDASHEETYSIAWGMFPSTYSKEIVACLMVDGKLNPETGYGISTIINGSSQNL